MKQIRAEDRPATQEEQAVLVKYVGWGGLPQAFDNSNQQWSKEFSELKELLTEDEYAAARGSTQNAHYTSPEIVNGIYEGLKRLGFTDGRVLEPSAGTGNFIGLMPPAMQARSKVTAIELDPITGQIGELLYPQMSYHPGTGYQDVEIPDGYFDVVIGNPPFGNEHVYDPKHKSLKKFSIHNYFFAKSMEKLRPGGILAMVVSHHMMDSRKNAEQRRYIAAQGKLLGAVRLPNNAFKENAGTEVTTDIIFLQKREDAHINRIRSKKKMDREAWEKVGRGEKWEKVRNITVDGEKVPLNEYFVDHPEMMLGEMALQGSMYRANEPALVGRDGQDIGADLSRAVKKLEKGAYKNNLFTVEEIERATAEMPGDMKNYGYFITDEGHIGQRLPDLIGERRSHIRAMSEKQRARATGMIGIRDTLNELMKAERLDLPNIEKLRAELNRKYDEFVGKLGLINSTANRHLIRDDPDFPRLLALENDYKQGLGEAAAKTRGVEPYPDTAVKADIFRKRVLSPPKRVEKADTAEDALTVSLNETARVDMERIAELRGLTEEEAFKELGDLVYEHNGVYMTAEEFLSGNVKKRLAEARAAGNARNIAALEKVQPVDKEPLEISANINAPWISPKDIEDFAKELIGGKAKVDHVAGTWIASFTNTNATADYDIWGTDKYPASKLIPAILNGKEIKVYKTLDDDKRVVDVEATLQANMKADEIRRAFIDNDTGEGFLWRDPERRERLAKAYNDLYNTNVDREYNGDYLTFPGMAPGKMLRDHGKRAVARGLQSSMLVDHAVGSGKTWVGAALAMELRRLGIARKPMIVVPNHLVDQWTQEFYSIYPNANILMTTKNDFSAENRKVLMSRIATGDWDAVVIAHSQFTMIPVPKEVDLAALQEEITDLEMSIEAIEASDGKKKTIKQIEKMKDSRKAKLKELMDKKEDDTVNFAELGVDALIVDEAHEFKNLFFTTSKQGVAGINAGGGSKKASDMFLKMRMVQKANGGKNTYFLTGTPISNSMTEMYTMQRYMQYDDMRERGLHHFDNWANTFGMETKDFELDATGVNYKQKTRFRSFQNMAQLQTMYRSFADVMLADDLRKAAEKRGDTWPVPKIKTVAPQKLLVERSPEQAVYMAEIVERMQNMPQDTSIDNPLKATNDARKMALDMRLIDPEMGDSPGNKSSVASEHIYRMYKEWDADKGTILVFIDLSTPKNFKGAEAKRIKDLIARVEKAEKTGKPDDEAVEALSKMSMDEIEAANSKFDVYNDIKNKLIDMGIPAEEIAFAHEGTTEKKLAALHAKVRSGEIRVFMGSTKKMGTGMNVQERLVGLINVDAPWRPSDIEQRIGRIVRQGNILYERDPENFRVEVINMATMQTYDARIWEILEQKQKIIEQVRSGVAPDTVEDIASSAATFSDMKAAATDSPLIMEQVKLTQKLRELEIQLKGDTAKRHRLESLINNADRYRQSRLSMIEESKRITEEAGGEGPHPLTVGGEAFVEEPEPPVPEGKESRKEKAARKKIVSRNSEIRKKGLAKLQLAHAKLISGKEREITGVAEYRGKPIDFLKTRTDSGKPVFIATWGPMQAIYNENDNFSAQGLKMRIDNYIADQDRMRDLYQQNIEENERDVAAAKVELDQPFGKQEEIDSVRERLNAVMEELVRMDKDPKYVPMHKRDPDSDYDENGHLINPPDYSMASGGQTGYTRESARRVASEIETDVPIVVIHSSEIPFDLPPGRAAKAYTNGNVITLVHDYIENDQDARVQIAHELIGHIGVNNIIEDWQGLMSDYQDMKRRGGKTFNEIHNELRSRYGALDAETELKEFIAIAAEKRAQKGIVGRFMDKLRELLNAAFRAMGFTRPFSMADINTILSKSEKSVSVDADTDLEYQFSVVEKAERDVAISKGLPMDKESRYARAEMQGYDTSKVWYRGQKKDRSIEGHPNILFFSESTSLANIFATPDVLDYDEERHFYQPNVTPVFLNRENVFDYENGSHVESLVAALAEGFPDSIEEYRRTGLAERVVRQIIDSEGYWKNIEEPIVLDALRQAGFDGFVTREEDEVDEPVNIGMFSTKGVRSINAAFDPEHIDDTTDIMFSMVERRAEELDEESPVAPAAQGPVRFTDPESENRFQEARKGLADQRNIIEKTSDLIEHVIHGFTRRHIDLPNRPEFALANEALRQYEAAPQAAKEDAIRALKNIVGKLNREEYELFTRKVILDDLAFEAELGHDLPFGFNPDTLAADKQRVDAAVAGNQKITSALNYRAAMNEALKENLVRAGILKKDRANNPAYFRHQVLMYAKARQIAQGSMNLKKPKPGYAKARHGSVEDINANYLEAEFEYMHRALIDIKAVDTIEKIKRDYDIAPALRKQAREASKESEEKVDWRDLLPEGYALWQPDKGNVFFTGLSVPEKVLNKLIDEADAEQLFGKEIDPEAVREVLESIRKAVMMGGKKMEMAIPEEIAATLNNMRPEEDRGLEALVLSVPQRMWKQWQLISPRRVVKYNLNNLSGDVDAVIAGNPVVLKKLPAAIKELFNVMYRGKEPSARYAEAVERGVFDAGLTVQEIPDINLMDPFAHLVDKPGINEPVKFVKSKLYSVWKALRNFTRFRENWLRYAAYLDYAERLEGGESIESIGYGASNPQMVDEILNNDLRDGAALLARDLVGDYGNVSHFGRGIRKKVMPFYSWLEVNTGRYIRLTRNAYSQGIGQGLKTTGTLGAITGARLTAWLGIRMLFMYTMVQLWNNLMFGDDEDELSATERTRLHINLGRDDNGQIRTLRFQGALSDFLQLFGFEDAVGAALEIDKGRSSWKDVMVAMAKGAPNRILSGLSPVFKLPAELLSGMTYWPDAFNPRTIRDKWRHVAKTFALEHEYDLVTGNPSRGYIESWKQAIIYTRDPGEQAYNKIRGLTFDWKEKVKGTSGRSSFTSPRSEATYRWRLAKKFGDVDAERKAMKEMVALGMKQKEINRVAERASPLAAIAKRDRQEFLKTLTPREMEALKQANKWYTETYGVQ